MCKLNKKNKHDISENSSTSTWRESTSLLLITISTALFLDNILVSAVVPILPQYLNELESVNKLNNNFASQMNNKSSENFKLSSNESLRDNLTATSILLNSSSFSEINLNNSLIESEPGNNGNVTEEGTKFGFLLGSKPLVQLIVNPFIGSLASRFGYRKVMFAGFILLFLSTLLFAYGETYGILFFARSLQGVASSCTTVTGLATVAKRFTDSKERENSMRIALGSLVLGLSLGPPFGGASYQFFGKRSPFLIICGLTLIDGCMLSIISEPRKTLKAEKVQKTSFLKLVVDPYIMIAAGGMFIVCGVYAVAEATLPLWMWDTMHANRLQVGLAFMPNPICFILVMNVLGKLCLRLRRWYLIFIGSIVSGLCLTLYPFCRDVNHVIVPSCLMGIGAAMIELAIMLEFSHLVDIRHAPDYGNVYAISDVAVCVGLSFGPACAGYVYEKWGFTETMFGAAFICFLYAPLGYLLKNPPVKNKLKDINEIPTTDKLLADQNKA